MTFCFPRTYCSSCGGVFGPGNQGFSHCDQHSPEAIYAHLAQEVQVGLALAAASVALTVQAAKTARAAIAAAEEIVQ